MIEYQLCYKSGVNFGTMQPAHNHLNRYPHNGVMRNLFVCSFNVDTMFRSRSQPFDKIPNGGIERRT